MRILVGMTGGRTQLLLDVNTGDMFEAMGVAVGVGIAISHDIA